MTERRRRRSEQAHLALNLFLEAVREREGLEGAAVTTEDGLLVAGAGALDVEWMGAVGAASQRSVLEWDERTLHVQRLEVNRVRLYLTSAGRRADARTVSAGLQRILAA